MQEVHSWRNVDEGGEWSRRRRRRRRRRVKKVKRKVNTGTHRAQPGTAKITRESATTIPLCDSLCVRPWERPIRSTRIYWNFNPATRTIQRWGWKREVILMGTEEARLMSFRVETGHWERRLASCLIWAPHSSGRSDLCGIGRPPWRTHLVSSIENSVAHSASSRSMILRDRSFGLSEIKTSCRWSLSRWERCPSCRFLLARHFIGTMKLDSIG